MTRRLEIHPVEGLPEIEEGTPLGELVAAEAKPEPTDVIVISQKVVSKAEGRTRKLGEVVVGGEAAALSTRVEKDPALVQLVLEESRRVVRAERGVLICETNDGWICANAGIDASNVPGESTVALLPVDGDASARRIRAELRTETGHAPAVIVSDSFGRPWRVGQAEVAIGCAGIGPADDWRGLTDREGAELSATLVALADQIAAAADLARDKAAGVPVVIVRGLGDLVTAEDGPGAKALQRPAGEDLFR